MPTPGPRRRFGPREPGCGLARALSKLGYCSRAQAHELIHAGRVRVNGRVQRDAEARVHLGRDRLAVDGQPVASRAPVYLMLNKPRGLVTTTADEQGRATVYECLRDPSLPRVFPVGRLDRASEGLLLFTNDTQWAERITAPEKHLDKTYHVQVDGLADEGLLERLRKGVTTAEGDCLSVKRAGLLRQGSRNSWVELVLDEGKNRHLRRLLAAEGLEVRRLVRVAIGPVELGNLAKGAYRRLSGEETKMLARPNISTTP
jgi:23S rRNA pseudouridine2605 synthase